MYVWRGFSLNVTLGNFSNKELDVSAFLWIWSCLLKNCAPASIAMKRSGVIAEKNICRDKSCRICLSGRHLSGEWWRYEENFGSREFQIGFMLWCSRIGAFLKNFGPQTINIWAMWTKLRQKNCPCRRFRAHGLFCDRPNPVSQNGPWTKHTAQMNTSCVGKDAHARWPSINTKISRHTDSDVENETTSLQPGIHSTPCATQPVIHRTRCVMLGLGLFTQNLLLGGNYQKEAQPVDQNGRAAQILFFRNAPLFRGGPCAMHPCM